MPSLGPSRWIASLAILGLLILWLKPLQTRFTWLLLLVCLGSGVLRAQVDQRVTREPSWAGRPILQGVVLEPPRRWGSSSVFFFRVDHFNDQECATRKVLVRWSGCSEDIAPGERWEFTGVLRKPESAAYPGGFSQRFWLWTQRTEEVFQVGKFSAASYLQPPRGCKIRALSHRARAWMLRRLEKVSDPQARSLIAGVVFGETQALSPELQEKFRRTGTSHLLAASGMNVALLAALVMGLARLFGFGPWRVAPLAAMAIIAYAFLAGCGPSILRATVGTLMALWALWLGRSSNAWNSMALSVWLLLLWEPRQIYDLGFQLSLAAVVGLVGGPKAPEGAGYVWRSTLLTLSASLSTLPFFWFSFGEVSSTLLLANLIVGPLVELLFPLGLVLTLVPLPPLLWLSSALAKLSLFLISWFSGLSDPLLLARPTAMVWLLLGVALCFWLWPSLERGRYWGLAFAALALTVGCWQSSQRSLPAEELLIRKIDQVHWVSCREGEFLFLRECWQERRARKMLRELGCLREPTVRVLGPEELLEIRWGAFDWQQVRSLLPKTPYLEVRTRGRTYTVVSWSPNES